ncbi:MAG TPA: hypothetical protein VIY52_26815 [Streptosporangiaceae bacterium]
MTTEPGTVGRPPHPVDQMTTGELSGYRQNLERALSADVSAGNWPTREQLQKRLEAVLEEQDERRRIAHANGSA